MSKMHISRSGNKTRFRTGMPTSTSMPTRSVILVFAPIPTGRIPKESASRSVHRKYHYLGAGPKYHFLPRLTIPAEKLRFFTTSGITPGSTFAKAGACQLIPTSRSKS